MSSCEILAPVGSIAALKAALGSGANAVYFGINVLNARMSADNFTAENLAEWVNYCHLFGVKVYLTLNTIIKESEHAEAVEIVKLSEIAKVDAIIFQDLSIIEMVKKFAPSVELHASTQLGIHNLYGAQFLEKLGVKRVVLARETLLSDIKEIKQKTKLEVECFVHGALCVSFSGNCYASSFINGGSGNRGRCLQTCRLHYSLLHFNKPIETKNEILSKIDNSKLLETKNQSIFTKQNDNSSGNYLLSTSDLNSFETLKEYLALGIDSIKIEGRMRSPHYVASSVSAYKKLLNGEKISHLEKFSSEAAFNRGGYTRGYNFDIESKLMSVKTNGNSGALLGKIEKILNGGKYLFQLDNPEFVDKIAVGDGVKVFTNGIEVGGGKITSLDSSGNKLIIGLNGNYAVGSSVSVTAINSFSVSEPKVEIKLKAVGMVGQPLTITATTNIVGKKLESTDVSATVCGTFILETSEKFGSDIITDELLKLGNSIFKANTVDFTGDKMLFIPKSELKSLKNRLISALSNEVINNYNSKFVTLYPLENISVNLDNSLVPPSKTKKIFDIIIETDTMIPKEILLENAVIAYFPKDFSIRNTVNMTISNLKRQQSKCSVFLRLPNIARGNDVKIIENVIKDNINQIDGLLCENLYAITLAKRYDLNYIAGYFLNIANTAAVKVINADKTVFSAEISVSDMTSIKKNCTKIDFYSYAFGHFPLMTLSHCPLKLSGVCGCDTCKYDEGYAYRDRILPFGLSRVRMEHCYFYLTNGAPHFVEKSDLKDIFCYYDCKGMTENDIMATLKGEKPEIFTKGYIQKNIK